MFCPICGAENEADKKYCRQCGQPLAAVLLAIEGRVDEAIKTVAGNQSLTSHRIRMGMGVFLILVAIATIVVPGTVGFSNIQSAAFVLIIIALFFMMLERKAHRVARVLDVDNQLEDLRLSQSINSPAAVGSGARGTVNLADPAPDSVIEQETLKLKREDQLPPG